MADINDLSSKYRYRESDKAIIDVATGTKVGTWRLGSDGKRKMTFNEGKDPRMTPNEVGQLGIRGLRGPGDGVDYRYRESDMAIIDPVSGKKVGTWTRKGNGERVKKFTRGDESPVTPASSRDGNIAYPEANLNLGSQYPTGEPGTSPIQVPQLPQVPVAGKSGFTPQEALNYQTMVENQMRLENEKRRQQGLDLYSYGQDQLRGMYQQQFRGMEGLDKGYARDQQLANAQMGDVMKHYDVGHTKNLQSLDRERGEVTGAINQGYNRQMGTLQGGLADSYRTLDQARGNMAGILDKGEQTIFSSLDKGQSGALGALGQGRTNALGALDAGEGKVYGFLDEAQNRTRDLFGKSYGYINKLGQQEEARSYTERDRRVAGMQQNLTGRGLGNSTITNSARRIHDRNLADSLLGIDELRARNMLGTLDQERASETNYGQTKAGYGANFASQRSGVHTGIAGQEAGVHQSFAGLRSAAGESMMNARSNNERYLADARNNATAGYTGQMSGVQGNTASQLANAYSGFGNTQRNVDNNYYVGRANAYSSQMDSQRNAANAYHNNWVQNYQNLIGGQIANESNYYSNKANMISGTNFSSGVNPGQYAAIKGPENKSHQGPLLQVGATVGGMFLGGVGGALGSAIGGAIGQQAGQYAQSKNGGSIWSVDGQPAMGALPPGYEGYYKPRPQGFTNNMIRT